MEQQRNDGVDRGPFGTLVEEAIEILDRGKTDEVPETIQHATQQNQTSATGNEDQTLGEEDIDEAAGG